MRRNPTRGTRSRGRTGKHAGRARGAPRCPNCGTPAGGRFCPGCGQEQGEQVLIFGYWVRHLARDYLSLDGRFPRSLLALLLRPGFLTREWLVGRRVRHTHPTRLLLLGAFTLFAVALADGSGSGPATKLLPFLAVATVPVMAAVGLLLERGAGRTYVEHLVFASHVQAFAFLLAAAVAVAAPVAARAGALGDWLFRGTVVLYVAVAFRRVFGDTWAWAAVKGVAFAAALYWLLLLALPVGSALALELLRVVGMVGP